MSGGGGSRDGRGSDKLGHGDYDLEAKNRDRDLGVGSLRSNGGRVTDWNSVVGSLVADYLGVLAVTLLAWKREWFARRLGR